MIQKHRVSYAVWSEVATNHPTWKTYDFAEGDDFEITTGNGELAFVAEVTADELTTWQTAFPNSISVVERGDAIVKVIGTSFLVVPPKEADGTPTFVTSPARLGWGTSF